MKIQRRQGPTNRHARGFSVHCDHKRVFIPYGCAAKQIDKCEYCSYRRAGLFMMKFGLKRQLASWNFNKQSYMWTLGTNVRFKRWYGRVELPEDWEQREKPNKKGIIRRVRRPRWNEPQMKWQDNASEIITLWQKFTTRLKVNRKRKGIPFRPLVYVVEAGKPCRYSPCVGFLDTQLNEFD